MRGPVDKVLGSKSLTLLVANDSGKLPGEAIDAEFVLERKGGRIRALSPVFEDSVS